MSKKTRILFKDKTLFKEKIAAIKRDGAKNLHVISDFDRTLTKAFVGGERTSTSFGLLRDSKDMPQEYRVKADKYFAKYHPLEMSHTILPKRKDKLMIEWWTKHLDLFVEYGLSKKALQDVVLKKGIHLRGGAKEVMSLLAKRRVPLLIFSAGLGDVIEGILKKEGLRTKNIHVISNFLKFNKAGRVISHAKEMIHSENKNESHIKAYDYHFEIEGRKNLILFGDSLSDIKMAQGLKHSNVLAIAYLNEEADKRLEKFLEVFDVVILGDGDLRPVREILEEIL